MGRLNPRRKWHLFILFISVFIFSCSPKIQIERVYEDGVEIVINHLEPYHLQGEPSTFDLEPVLTIDLERDDLAEAGLGQPGEFDVDGEGNIYIVAFKNKMDFIYRFNEKGEFLDSFGSYGQGPGELEWPFLNRVFLDGRIALTDRMRKYIVFDKEGHPLQEIRPVFSISYVYPLETGALLVYRPRYEDSNSRTGPFPFPYSLSLCTPDFKEIKELDRYQWDSGEEGLPAFFIWRVSAGHIYIANEERGYEILDYDLKGNLKRKIRKDYRRVAATEEIKKARVGPGYEEPGISLGHYFPDPLPPMSSFFVDDEGRLFVMTYEPGENPGEFLYDIFNADGVFIGRKSLNAGTAQFFPQINYAKVKKGHLYHYREKENGFEELTVQRMIWKK
jgi:hypothetical protein